MANPTIETCSYKSISASNAVVTGPGRLWGILVTASSSGVIKIWDSTGASGTVLVDTLTIAAKDNLRMPASFTTGCYVQLVSGSATLTVFFE